MNPGSSARASLALSLVPGVGPVLFGRLVSTFGGAAKVFGAGPALWREVEGVTPRAASALAAFNQWNEVDRQLESAARLGFTVLAYEDDLYPALLRNALGAPPVLFLRGAFTNEDRSAVAIVGTRHPDAYGLRAAADLAGELAARGVTIVSGLANGIDQQAHRAALDRGGRTLAVLGCGLDVDYPSKSAALREQIAAHGALVSEFPPGTEPLPENFRRRNRVISGLSKGVILVQGGARSGALITARYALEQDREVFCVPGSIYSERSEASHQMLRQGAILVERAEDVLGVLWPALVPAVKSAAGTAARATPEPAGELRPELTPDERRIFERVVPGEVVDRDTIVSRAGLDAAHAAPLLVGLEIKGLLKARPGGLYTRA